MELEKLIGYQLPPNCDQDVLRRIIALGDGEIIWTVLLAVSYGIILGKQELRRKKKAIA